MMNGQGIWLRFWQAVPANAQVALERAAQLVDPIGAPSSRRRDRARTHPVMFQTQLMGWMLLASNGLLKYTRAADIRTCAARGVDALIDSVRLKNGALQDDVAVILLE
jgi:hypothetical protein